jgi:hypothetical protein
LNAGVLVAPAAPADPVAPAIAPAAPPVPAAFEPPAPAAAAAEPAAPEVPAAEVVLFAPAVPVPAAAVELAAIPAEPDALIPPPPVAAVAGAGEPLVAPAPAGCPIVDGSVVVDDELQPKDGTVSRLQTNQTLKVSDRHPFSQVISTLPFATDARCVTQTTGLGSRSWRLISQRPTFVECVRSWPNIVFDHEWGLAFR